MKKIVSLLVICLLSVSLLIGCSIPTQKNTAMQKREASQAEFLQNVNTDATTREDRKEIADPVSRDGMQVEKKAATDIAAASGIANAHRTLCNTCGDDDCDDGIYCDDADERKENLRDTENRKKGTPCEVCGEYDCGNGGFCDVHRDDHKGDHHGRHGRHHKE